MPNDTTLTQDRASRLEAPSAAPHERQRFVERTAPSCFHIVVQSPSPLSSLVYAPNATSSLSSRLHMVRANTPASFRFVSRSPATRMIPTTLSPSWPPEFLTAPSGHDAIISPSIIIVATSSPSRPSAS